MTEVKTKQYETPLKKDISSLLNENKKEITQMWEEISKIKNLEYNAYQTEEGKKQHEKELEELIETRNAIIRELKIYPLLASIIGDKPERIMDLTKTIMWDYSNSKQTFIDCLNAKLDAYTN